MVGGARRAAIRCIARLASPRHGRSAARRRTGLGDILTLWAALRVFDVHISAPALVLGYGTGWALTRRSLPLGGPGLVEILLAFVLTWFHV